MLHILCDCGDTSVDGIQLAYLIITLGNEPHNII